MVVQTVYGKVEGIQTGGCNVYYGIPFAKPPVLDLTFRHPLPPDPWEGTLAADKGSKNPIQPPTKYGMKNNSLDCLYLNVFVPEGLTKPAPVMVWIYGGSYYEGGAGTNTEGSTELVYDMSYFAKETGCIVVTFNYRLNVYGFLNLHFLDDKFDQNNGLYDQIMALKFVNENIAAFGGDPQNVTVFGQSAGAACILALMTMPEASGLYQKTIVQSPCAEHFFTEEESEKNTKKFLLFAGVKSPEELLYLPENELLSAAKRYYEWTLARGEIRCAFSPTIDGVTLKECPKDAVKASKVPMMIGSVTEEGNLFINPIPTILLPVLQAYLKLPPRKSNLPYKKRVSDALTEHVYIRPIKDIVENYSGQVWRYVFDYCTPDNKFGICHICELPVLFGLDGIMGNPNDEESKQVGKRARKIWSDFAHKGDPGWKEGTGVWIR